MTCVICGATYEAKKYGNVYGRQVRKTCYQSFCMRRYLSTRIQPESKRTVSLHTWKTGQEGKTGKRARGVEN